jgi:hypothetical protein
MSDDLQSRIERVAMCADLANHYIDGMRVMPSEGVRMVQIDALTRIKLLQEEIGILRTEKHADAEAIGYMQAQLAKARGALETGIACTSEHGGAAKFLKIARETLALLDTPTPAPTPSPEANTCECGMTGPCKSDECKHPFLTATPSPEAVLVAALKWAANEVDCGGCYGTCMDPSNCNAEDARIIRAAASDPDTITAIIKTAEERKDE